MSYRVLIGDCIEQMRTMPDNSVNCCVTSPPYFGLRDYGMAGQIGLEETPDAFIARLVEVFREVRRVLRNDGTCWVNMGDSYAANRSYQVASTKGGPKHGQAQIGPGSKVPEGLKPKDRMMIPARIALALQADGWWLRDEIVWHKPNPMPSSVKDRTSPAHEMIYLLTKRPRYWFDAEAWKEPGTGRKTYSGSNRYSKGSGRGDAGQRNLTPCTMRNRRSVWTVSTKPYIGAHFATFPPDLIEPCILAGCPKGGTVLDPFGGSGTTAGVALRNGRDAIICELNPAYAALAADRVAHIAGPLTEYAERIAAE